MGVSCHSAETAPTPEHVRLTIDDETAARLKASASFHGVSVAELVRRLLTAASRRVDDLLP